MTGGTDPERAGAPGNDLADTPEIPWAVPLEGLVSRYGVVNTVVRSAPPRGLPELALAGATLGSGTPGKLPGADQTTSGGRAVGNPPLARALALAEAAERYSAWEPRDTGYLRATAAELPGRVMDHRFFPRCTDAEYAHPACPVRPFDPDAPIRWSRGTDLFTGEQMWVPACMATYRLPSPEPAERFWYPISTGFAVHTDIEAAVFGAVGEVVERDAIAVLWLQRLPLPELTGEAMGEDARGLVAWCREHHVEARLFDATSDVGLPTTYAVLHSPHDPDLRNLVGCGAGLTTEETAYKALLEAVSLRVTLNTAVRPPAEFADFHGLTDGTRFTGSAAHAHAFDFLLRPRADRPAYRPAGPFAPDVREGLRRLRTALAGIGTEAVIVDRTTGELADAGLLSVNAVIPGLHPMSLHPLAQFKAHPRLYRAPARMGFAAAAPEDLNPLPQPFA